MYLPCTFFQNLSELLLLAHSSTTAKSVGQSDGQPLKAPTSVRKLPCSLEELYTGSTIKIMLSRTAVHPNGSLVLESEILTVDLKPGWKKGTKITIPNKGKEASNQLPGDVVFVIDEKPHHVFKRGGNELIVHYKIELMEALSVTTMNLKTLDGHDLAVSAPDVATPAYELVVPKEGMPIFEEPGNKRNLRIKFDAVFPPTPSSEQRKGIRQSLGG